jgi:hypothetical protein
MRVHVGVRASVLLLAALVAGSVAGRTGQVSASANPPAHTSRATAAVVPSLPFRQDQDYDWPLTPSTDASNRVVSNACNNGKPLYAAAWAKYTTPTARRILARTTDNNAPVAFQDDTIRNMWGVAMVSGDGSRVLGCMQNLDQAQTLPLTLAASQSVYVVRWATSQYGSNDEPPNPPVHGNVFVASTTGSAPANDDLARATPITAVPYSNSVDTLLASEEPTDLDSLDCHGAGGANNTAWWSYTPARSGYLKISGARYILAKVTATGREIVYDPGDCTGSLAQPHVDAGTRYLIEVLTPQPSFFTDWGPLLVPGGPTTLRVALQVGPTAATAVTATTDDATRSATLRWAAPASDGGSPVTGYRVARDGRDSGGAGPWSTTVGPAARSFRFTLLRPWDTYRLSVRALNADGAGPATVRTVMIRAATPSAPSGVKATAGSARATVTWTAPTQTGASAVTGYRVRRYAGTGTTVQATTTAAATARTFTATGLVNGRGYSFDVTAINGSGPGVVSSRSNVVTPG